MMCEECREWMLEADVDALTGDHDSPLTLHLAICSSCRDEVAEILGRHDALQRQYAGMSSSTDAGTVARLAMAAGRVTTAAVEEDVIPMSRRQVWRFVGVGIAAGLALLLVSERGGLRLGDSPTDASIESEIPEHAPLPAPNISVGVPEGQNAIVMETSDPKISVVWIYQ